MCILESDRLILRPPRPSDIPALTVWLGDYDVAKNLARVPHPYGEADAEDFVAVARQAIANIASPFSARTDGLFWAASRCTAEPKAGSWAIGWASPFGVWAMPPRRRGA